MNDMHIYANQNKEGKGQGSDAQEHSIASSLDLKIPTQRNHFTQALARCSRPHLQLSTAFNHIAPVKHVRSEHSNCFVYAILRIASGPNSRG